MSVSTVLVECYSVSDTGFRCGVEMRLKDISILVAVLESLDSPASKFTLTTVMSAVNAAANINVQVKE